MAPRLFSHFRVPNVRLILEKNSVKYYSLNVREHLEIGTTP